MNMFSRANVAVTRWIAVVFIAVCCAGCDAEHERESWLLEFELKKFQSHNVSPLPVKAFHIARDSPPDSIFWNLIGIRRHDAGLYVVSDDLYSALLSYADEHDISYRVEGRDWIYGHMYGYIFFSSVDYDSIMTGLRTLRPGEYGYAPDRWCTPDFVYYVSVLSGMLCSDIDHVFSLADDGSGQCLHWHERYDEYISEIISVVDKLQVKDEPYLNRLGDFSDMNWSGIDIGCFYISLGNHELPIYGEDVKH